jgi:hypothetical protein
MPDPGKIRIFHSLLHYTHMRDAKEGLLAGYNALSSKELTNRQLDELIGYLRDILDKQTEQKGAFRRKLMHQCLKLISDIGVNTKDWNKVNEFMLNRHVCGRHLYELDTDQLIEFKKKLYAILAKVNENKEKERQLSQLN